MEAHVPQDFIAAILSEKGATAAERETALLALGGRSNADIARELGLSDIAVRKRLGEVYKKLEIEGKGPGKLSALQHKLERLYQGRGRRSGAGRPPGPHFDVPHIDPICERSEDLETLERAIVTEGCRCLALVGMAGTGKTTLSVQLARRLRDRFAGVAWRSLRRAPSLEELLADLAASLFDDPGNKSDDRLSHFIDRLGQQPYLIILDDFETILQSETLAGQFREGYEPYREWLHCMVRGQEKSCLVVVSAETPSGLTALNGNKVRSISPSRGENVVRALFADRQINTTPQEWKELFDRYGNNLLAFKMAAAAISEFFAGNTGSFLKATAIYFDEHTSGSLLDTQFDRLSDAEEEVMYWLAIVGEPMSIDQLRDRSLRPLSVSATISILDSLGRRSLVEKVTMAGEVKLTLQPLVEKYVRDRLAKEIDREIRNFWTHKSLDDLKLLKNYQIWDVDSQIQNQENGLPSVSQQAIAELKGLVVNKNVSYGELIAIVESMASQLDGRDAIEIGYAKTNINGILGELREVSP